MNIFYTPDISSTHILSEEESMHCIRVLRMAAGEQIQIVDGKGNLYKAEITDAHPKKCGVRIIESIAEFGKRDFYLHMVVAPTKNIERFEWFLEKAAEIGVNEITPVICKHSERTVIKTERLNKVLVSAMKQSLKAFLPKLNEAVKLEEVFKNNFSGQKFIAHCREGEKAHLKNAYQKQKDVLILIGPEGDFTEEEVKHASEKGFKEISLGSSRLRTETAGIVATEIINLLND